GATGHIGGAIVNAIWAQLPEVEVAALVRDQDKAARLEKAYPRIRAIVGDIRNVNLIESESKAAGIVISMSYKAPVQSPAAIEAALRGLALRPRKGFYIQTSGAFLVGEDAGGERGTDMLWNDVQHIERIITMSPDRYHQRTDQLVRHESTDVNVAIVSPTVVYGLSKSTQNQIPITIRDIVATAKRLSAGFTIAQGRNILGYVHVNDLADIYVKLVADAERGSASDARLWGPHSYYFANGEELTFAEYMEALVETLKERGVISTDVIKEIGAESNVSDWKIVNATAVVHGYGMTVRCQSERAQTLLGWKPREKSVKETLPEVVDLILSRELW
ncbi:hypothetical protein BKA67DRAFT_528643, partial [Truncatella angustata]